jgi:hypothetical protein
MQHCEGPPSNPYKIKHVGDKHAINKEYARGHGENGVPIWFRFFKKLSDGWWDMESGQQIPVEEVPASYK